MMRCLKLLRVFCLVMLHGVLSDAAQDDPRTLERYRDAGRIGGDPESGRKIFESSAATCTRCHGVRSKQRLAGPDLAVIGDKYTRDQLVQAVLEPSAGIHPDYASMLLVTNDGKSHVGVVKSESETAIELFDGEGKVLKIATSEIEERQRSRTSLMPNGITKSISAEQFKDLIAFLESLRQPEIQLPGMPAEIPMISKPVRLEPLHAESMRFDHPVWIIAKPGSPNVFLVVEQQTRKIWQYEERPEGHRKTLFADISHEAITGQFEGVMCLAFHPDFENNRKYYLNYHVREDGVFSPVIAERLATPDLQRDAGGASRRLLKIPQPTDLHWGGMLAFGPDGYLYIGAGDAGPQEDPDGHGQDLSLLIGKILRIDVDSSDADRAYAIPESNPFRDAGPGIRPEIWAYGFRMPWRFSWDSETGDHWVGDIGQNLFEEVTIVRRGENHGWNVYEAFMPFSERYRREGEIYTPPVVSYRRRLGVSVTGGYVYRGKRSDSFRGVYLFSDFESRRIWGLTQSERRLIKIRQLGTCPEKPSSFGIDHDGELFIVGYEGTIFRVILDDSVFD